ncbi:MAG: lysophospholipid acyltransferase family protein [Verrucomicrobiota bacterium]|nr:lysophospholipid acyltransferase family protein [Verrucomicrobiota bacterium]
MSIWKKLRYKLEWLCLQLLYTLIPLLPRKAALGLSKGLGSLGFAVDKRGRNIAIENLTLIFGEEKNDSEIRTLAKKSYRSFAQTVVDQFWSKRLTAESIETYCSIEAEDWDVIDAARETGAIWVTPHYSNFEWIALIMGFRGYSFTIVAQDFKNPSLTEIYKKNREISGHKVIPQRGALRQLLKSLKNKGHAAFLTDLTIPPSKAATIIECFDHKTCVTAIHAELMKRTGLPVIPGICIPSDDGTYLFKSFKALSFGPDDNEQTIAQACWNIFEPHIRENPAPWLWMYKHWRYLPRVEETRYPSYARKNDRFEKACERQIG